MGTGDWNDGMNRVGRGGKGESVWLAFFLHDVLKRFAVLAAARRRRFNATVHRPGGQAPAGHRGRGVGWAMV